MHCIRPSSVKLAGVKHELYNPLLPTLRKMDMDDVTKKLPHEHSRTSTIATREVFENGRSTLRAPKEKLCCQGVLSRQTDAAMKAYKPLNVPSYTESWNQTLELLNMSSIQVQPGASKISGLTLRSKQPAITGSWQYYSNKRPSTARPLPATMYSRHRALRRPPTAEPWK